MTFFSVFMYTIYLNFPRNSTQSCGRVQVLDQAALETLCSGSSGDIRSAINGLQFMSFPGQEKIHHTTPKGHENVHMHAVKVAVYAF